MAKWRWYAESEFPRVVRQLNLPAARSRPDLDTCPRHNEPIGSITHLCERCFREARDGVGQRYASAAQGRGTNRKEDTNDAV
jgi:hypothetical protein